MRANLNQLAALALREAIGKHVEQNASPLICGRIKREFVRIMRDKFGVNWTRYERQITVEFINGKTPNLMIPPHLLKRTLH